MLLVLIYSSVPVHARTVAIVYDDSTSMCGQDKYVYSNYAAQVLISLLQKNDSLAVVHMRRDRHVSKINLKKDRQNDLDLIRNTWGCQGSKTPYKAVETAMDELLRRVSITNKSVFKEQHQDWLIVTTDGNFDNPGNIESSVRDFIQKSGGKIRIVFLLIGDGAGRDIPQMWENIAPEQVDILSVRPVELAKVMRNVAAMINGRDNKSITMVKKDKTISFNSLFPLQRLTVFEQVTGNTPVKIDHMSWGNNQIIDTHLLTDYTVRSRKGGLSDNFEGRFSSGVVHYFSDQILPAGNFSISFRSPIEQRSVQVLLETAVDFKVLLIDQQGVIKVPDKQGIFEVCSDDSISVNIQFVETGTGKVLPLTISNTADMKITASMSGQKNELVFNPKTKSFDPAVFKLKEGSQYLSVLAVYPGYFHLKSNLMTIKGRICEMEKSLSIENNDSVIPVPYLFSKEPKPVDHSIKLKAIENKGGDVNISGPDTIKTTGIPKGIIVRIKDKDFSHDNPFGEISGIKSGDAIPLKILRNMDYRESSPGEILLKFSSNDQNTKWINNNVKLKIKPENRVISINKKIPGPENKNPPKATSPVAFTVQVGGKEIKKEELNDWEFKVKNPFGVSFDIVTDETAPGVQIIPKPYFCSPCLTKVGESEWEITAIGPFPNEKITKTFSKNITYGTFRERCGPFLLKALLILLLIIWLFGVIKKLRFKQNSYVTFKEKIDNIDKKPQTYELPEGWFRRWVVPFIGEKKQVRNLIFRPGRTDKYILISKDQALDNVYVDGVPIGNAPWTTDIRLNEKSVLLIRDKKRNRQESYIYND